MYPEYYDSTFNSNYPAYELYSRSNYGSAGQQEDDAEIEKNTEESLRRINQAIIVLFSFFLIVGFAVAFVAMSFNPVIA